MAWRASRGLILAFSDDFSQFRLKTGYYKFSYRMSIVSTSSPTGSPAFLQEQAERLGNGIEGGMELG